MRRKVLIALIIILTFSITFSGWKLLKEALPYQDRRKEKWFEGIEKNTWDEIIIV